MFRLIPKNENYFDLFNQMANRIYDGALLLSKLFDDFERKADHAKRIKTLEHECDEFTHNIVRKLNQTFITPIDREDVYLLSSRLDDVMDIIDDVANRTVMYRVEHSTEAARRLSSVLTQAVAQVGKAVSMLGSKESIMDYCIEIHRLENEGDSLYHEAIGRLFHEERDALTVLKWKELYETSLEKGIDKCEDIANILEAVVLKNA